MTDGRNIQGLNDRIMSPVAEWIEKRVWATLPERNADEEEKVYSREDIRFLLRMLRIYWAALVFAGFLLGLCLGLFFV